MQKKPEKVTKRKSNKRGKSNQGKQEVILRDDPIKIDEKIGL